MYFLKKYLIFIKGAKLWLDPLCVCVHKATRQSRGNQKIVKRRGRKRSIKKSDFFPCPYNFLPSQSVWNKKGWTACSRTSKHMFGLNSIIFRWLFYISLLAWKTLQKIIAICILTCIIVALSVALLRWSHCIFHVHDFWCQHRHWYFMGHCYFTDKHIGILS